MRFQETIFDQIIPDIQGHEYRVAIESVLDDEQANIELFIRVLDGDAPISLVSIKASVTNPIDLFSVILGAVGLYALCVATNFIGSVGRLIYQAYDASKKEEDMSRVDRCRDIVARLKQKDVELKGDAIKILTGCISRMQA